MHTHTHTHTHSLILTHGTNSFIRSFPVTLENPHVVDGQQAWVGVAKVGPDNVPLNSSYAQRLVNVDYPTSVRMPYFKLADLDNYTVTLLSSWLHQIGHFVHKWHI